MVESQDYIRRAVGTLPQAVDEPPRQATDDPQTTATMAMVRQRASELGVDPDFATRIAATESNFDPNAVSPVGARGVMQVMPETAKKLAPVYGNDNIAQGVGYLKDLREKHVDLAAVPPEQHDSFVAAGYNAGPERLKKAREKAAEGGFDPNNIVHVERFLPKETRDYIVKTRADPSVTPPDAAPTLSVPALMADEDFQALAPHEKVMFATKLIPQLGELTQPDLEKILGIKPESLTPGAPSWAEHLGIHHTPLGTVVDALQRIITDPEQLGAMGGEAAGLYTGIPGAGMAGAALGGGGGALLKGAGLDEAALAAVKNAGLSGIGNVAARGITAVGRGGRLFTTGGGARNITEAGREAEAFLGPELAKQGFKHAPLSAAELNEAPLLDIAQNFAEEGIGGAGYMRQYHQGRTLAVGKLVDDFLTHFGPETDPEVVAKVFRQGVESGNADSMVASSLARGQFRVEARTVPVAYEDLQRLSKIAQPYIERAARTGNIGGDRTGAGLAQQVLDMVDRMKPRTSVVERQVDTGAIDAAGQPIMQTQHGTVPVSVTPVNLEDLDKLQQTLADMKRGLQAGERVPKDRLHLLKVLDREVNKIIEAKAPPELYDLFKRSDAAVRERIGSTDSPFLRKLVRISDPEKLATRGGGGGGDKLVDSIFSTPNTIAATKRAIGQDSDEWKMLQRRYLQRSLAAVSDSKTGEINGARLLDSWFGKRGELESVFKAAVPDQGHREWLTKFGHSLRTIQEKGISTGRVATQLGQGGAVLVAAQSGLEGNVGRAAKLVASVVIPPAIVARMLTGPRTARLLTLSLTTPATAKEAASLVGRLGLEAKAIHDHERFEDFRDAQRTGITLPVGQGEMQATMPQATLPPGMRPSMPLSPLEGR